MSSSTRKYQHLTDEQTAHFMKYGYLRLTNCFTPSQAAQWTSAVWTRLGFSPTDKSTWTRERTNMPAHNTVAVSSFAPKAWAAICELCGGEDRIHPASRTWNDALIVNLGSPENEGKELDPKKLSGWHVDGDFFVHFLDSPEQGLLVIPVFTEIVPNGGGTVVAPEGVGRIARHLVCLPFPNNSPGEEIWGLEFSVGVEASLLGLISDLAIVRTPRRRLPTHGLHRRTHRLQ